MPKLPLPPATARLAQLGAETRVVPTGATLTRIYFAGWPYPTAWNGFRHYGPLRGRFDPHLPPAQLQRRGVMYVADSLLTCLAEVFQAKRRIDVVTAQPMLATFALTRDVSLLDMVGLWLAYPRGRIHGDSLRSSSPRSSLGPCHLRRVSANRRRALLFVHERQSASPSAVRARAVSVAATSDEQRRTQQPAPESPATPIRHAPRLPAALRAARRTSTAH